MDVYVYEDGGKEARLRFEWCTIHEQPSTWFRGSLREKIPSRASRENQLMRLKVTRFIQSCLFGR